MSKNVKQSGFLLAVLLAGCGLDLWTKSWAQRGLAGGTTVTVFRSCLEMRYAENIGVAFSFLGTLPAGLRIPLILASNAVALAFLVYLAARWWEGGVLHLLPLACVIGGTLGNLHDRLRFGYVRDFIHLHYHHIWSWPIFNIADSLMVVGLACLLVLHREELTGRPGRASGSTGGERDG